MSHHHHQENGRTEGRRSERTPERDKIVQGPRKILHCKQRDSKPETERECEIYREKETERTKSESGKVLTERKNEMIERQTGVRQKCSRLRKILQPHSR